MKVNKSMYEQELQSLYRPMNLLASMMTKNWGVTLFNFGVGTLKRNKLKGAQNDERYLPSKSTPGHKIRVRIFRPEHATERLPAMLYLHGGGYMVGAPEQDFTFYERVLQKRDVAIIAPDYRLSKAHPFPAGFNDCYDTLLWMKEHADELKIYPERFMVAGHSAGGGMTAAVTLKARDTQDVDIAFQMPVYPMIDHRQESESAQMVGAPVWDANTNAFAWNHYLKGLSGQDIPAYASPALNEDYTNFPPTISFVGDLEPFRDETIAYIEGLKGAGIPTMFKLFEGAFHGFETIAPQSRLGAEAYDFQIDGFAEFFDRYVKG